MILDFYHYYLRRMETRPDQKAAIRSCRDMAVKLFETGPMTWAVASGAALLTALHEVKARPGINLLPIFNEVEEALFAELQGIRLDLEMDADKGIRNTGCGQPRQHNRDYREGE